jgi:hypothetical protein
MSIELVSRRSKHDLPIAVLVAVLFVLVVIIASIRLGWDSSTQLPNRHLMERGR